MNDLDHACRRVLKYLPPTFLAEDMLAKAMKYLDEDVPDKRIMGGVIRRLAADGLIFWSGYAQAKTSHGSAKCLWSRVS